MGTKHLICIFYQGRFAVAQYGQFDGNPEGHGYRLYHFISNPSNPTALKAALPHLVLQTDIDPPGIPEDPDANSEEWAARSSQRSKKAREHPVPFGRDASTDVLNYIVGATADKPRPIATWLPFANDASCDWVYVVDLDAEVLEVYSNETDVMLPLGQGRLWTVMEKGPRTVDLAVRFLLARLPGAEKFVGRCQMGDANFSDFMSQWR